MSNERLSGKIALVTGAASGMGLAEARLFAEQGAIVIAADLADQTAEPAGAAGPQLHYRTLDVAEEQSWGALAGWIADTFGKLDILVNNAAIQRIVSLEDTTPEIFDTVQAVNQRGVYLGMRAVIPLMRAAGGGSIVNISSSAGLQGRANMFAYVASKFAVRGMTKAAAIELARDRIRVNSVHPGLIDTPMTRRGSAEQQRARAEATTFGRAAEPIEMARLVAFLASDEASYCSGGEYTCDGAATAGPN
ncbi:MAG: SDR family oxidoreductase [Pseudomonadota bacterium]